MEEGGAGGRERFSCSRVTNFTCQLGSAWHAVGLAKRENHGWHQLSWNNGIVRTFSPYSDRCCLPGEISSGGCAHIEEELDFAPCPRNCTNARLVIKRTCMYIRRADFQLETVAISNTPHPTKLCPFGCWFRIATGDLLEPVGDLDRAPPGSGRPQVARPPVCVRRLVRRAARQELGRDRPPPGDAVDHGRQVCRDRAAVHKFMFRSPPTAFLARVRHDWFLPVELVVFYQYGHMKACNIQSTRLSVIPSVVLADRACLPRKLELTPQLPFRRRGAD